MAYAPYSEFEPILKQAPTLTDARVYLEGMIEWLNEHLEEVIYEEHHERARKALPEMMAYLDANGATFHALPQQGWYEARWFDPARPYLKDRWVCSVAETDSEREYALVFRERALAAAQNAVA